MLSSVNRSRRQKGQSEVTRNHYGCLLYLPTHGVGFFLSDVSSNVPRSDVMCYAKLDRDKTPAILHGVLSCESFAKIFESMCRDGLNPWYLSYCGRLVQLKVDTPNSCTKSKQYTANVIVLPQLLSTNQVESQYTH